jgi:outer membrane protein assembly factor BamB
MARVASGWRLPLWLALCVGALAACSSTPPRPEPAPLAPAATRMAATLAWSVQLGPTHAMLAPRAVAGRVFVANTGGTVAALDAATGQDIWRINLAQALDAGVGADGQTAAVITQGHDLVALRDGQEMWRVRLPARSFSAPLVAGQRVFVLTADRTVRAFDGQTGARLWVQSRPAEPLVLSQTGALLAVGDTLVAGLAGRLVGLNPLNGTIRWDVPVATPRGANEVERLVDVVGPASRVGNSVCVRAYAAAVACVDAGAGTLTWNRPAQGMTGLHGDEQLVFGTETDGRVRAWQRVDGATGWDMDRLQYRRLTAPLAAGRVVAVGDADGLVHLLARDDGSEMTRLSTDGSAIESAPVLAGDMLLVQTRNGGVYAWRPQ